MWSASPTHRGRTRWHLLLAVALGLSLLPLAGMPAADSATSPRYAIRGLGSLGGGQTTPNAINASKQIVGTSATMSGELHAFLWDNGVITDLGVNGVVSSALDINDSGQVLVQIRDGVSYLWEDGSTQPIDGLANPHGLNNLGQVAGTANGHAAIWDDSDITQLALSSAGASCMGLDINDAGDVGGACHDNPEEDSPARGVIWRNGSPAAGAAEATIRINQRGDGIGNGGSLFSTYSEFVTNTSSFSIEDLDPNIELAFPNALGLNDFRQVVGSSHVSSGQHAYLWQDDRMLDLNQRIPASSNWLLNEASAINNQGQIVGIGERNGNPNAFLLSPWSGSDTVAPTITVRSPALNGRFVLDQRVDVEFECIDEGGSGLASCTGTTTNGSRVRTGSVGSKTFIARAIDNDGNVAVERVPYTVAYAICPLYDEDEVYANTRTLSVRLQICDAQGDNYSSADLPVRIHALTPGRLPQKATHDATYNFIYVAGPDGAPGYYRYALNLRRLDPGTYTLGIYIGGRAESAYRLTIRVGSDPNPS